MNAVEFGELHSSCAMEWRKSLGLAATQANAYLACDRGDWLIWQLQFLPSDKLKTLYPEIIELSMRIVTDAVEICCPHCGIKCVEQWAAKWISGEDRTYASVTDAFTVASDAVIVVAADDAAAAAAYAAVVINTVATYVASDDVAYAVYSAAIAVYSAADAVYSATPDAVVAETLKKWAGWVRDEIPEWPGG